MISPPLFYDAPSIELLQWLARGSLKQNLARAVRLWVWLRSLYGDESERVVLSDSFTYAQWRDAFFTATHPKGEEIPSHDDSQCRCHRTAAEWLFTTGTGVKESDWRRSLVQHAGICDQEIDQWLQTRLFTLTRRMLAGDLQTLTQLQWLTYHQRQYYRVQHWPARPTPSSHDRGETRSEVDEFNFLHPELADIASNHYRKVNGIQRFFLHTEYVIPKETIDKVGEFHYQLRQIWEQTPIPPVLLMYQSAKLEKLTACIVYPVCVYYMQRATYLCAWGANPQGEMNWNNYRLDRIQEITPLNWKDSRLPRLLKQRYQQKTLPTPDYIQQQIEEAWGFDFYQKAFQMLLRFDPLHNRRYIQGTVRHETFQQVSYQQALSLVKKQAPPQQRQMLLNILQSRSPEDAYYTAYYREGDPNILMRLQAWRPFVEVILPWQLRSRMAADVQKEWEFYR